MALETFKAQLKAKAKTLGVTNLQNKRIDAYAATLEEQNPNLATDDDHSEVVDKFLKLVDIKQIASYDDWQASKGKNGGKAGEKKDEPNNGKNADGADTGKSSDGDPKEQPTEMQQLMKAVQTLTETVSKLQSEKQATSMRQRLKENLKDIPENFYKKWALPEKEEDLEAFQEEVKTEWETFAKENNVSPASGSAGSGGDSGAGGHKPGRGSGGSNDKASQKEIDNVVNNIM